MISTFIDRENELNLLQQGWKSSKSSLIIIHGRRRIGKTRLIMEYCLDKEGIFYIAEDASKHIQINALKSRIADFLGDTLLESLEIKEWEQRFEYVFKNAPKKRFYFVIDEFTYLIKAEARILSTLQKYWDLYFSKMNVQIILSGSLVGLMNEQVLAHSSPLYGRRTRDILLGSLTFKDSRKFMKMDALSQLKTFMTLGGIPDSLLQASDDISFDEFARSEFFNKQGYFFREPYFILSQELREIKIYFSILHAIAYGNTQPTKIANFVGKPARSIYPYLENLILLDIIQRETPLLGNQKQGIYIIKDNIFDFWFKFVFNNRELIERGKYFPDKPALNTFFGKKFEQFGRQELFFSHFPDYEKCGRWWYKDEEIDIVGINDQNNAIIFIECKWSDLDDKDVQEIM